MELAITEIRLTFNGNPAPFVSTKPDPRLSDWYSAELHPTEDTSILIVRRESSKEWSFLWHMGGSEQEREAFLRKTWDAFVQTESSIYRQ